jgi:hypothetical protein
MGMTLGCPDPEIEVEEKGSLLSFEVVFKCITYILPAGIVALLALAGYLACRLLG